MQSMHRNFRARCTSRAALVAFVVSNAGLAMAPTPARADETVSEEARRHFKAGVAYLQDPDGERPEEAYVEFKLAYSLSKSPKILGNLALCAMKLERDGEAIDAYKQYLMEVSDIDDDERRQINTDIATLTASATKLTITVDAPQTRIFDTRVPVRGAPITNVYGPVDGKLEIHVRTGHHRLEAKAGTSEARWELDAVGGAQVSHDFHLVAPGQPVVADEPAPPRHGSRIAPIITMGVGGAMLATAAITGLVALGKTRDLERSCPDDACPAGFDYQGRVRSLNTFATVTDVLLVGGAVVTLGGVAWFVLTDSKKTSAAPASASALCTSDGCAASLRYRFQ